MKEAGKDTGSLDRLIGTEDKNRLLDKIARIEKRSSGEVRIHVTGRRVGDPLEAARKTFTELGMTATKRRNAVLVFLSIPSRAFAIVGDEGIDRVTPDEYWDRLRDRMSERFVSGSFADGLIEVLDEVEKVLSEHFPHEQGDVDELPDAISYQEPRSRVLPWLLVGAVLAAAASLVLVWRLFFSGW